MTAAHSEARRTTRDTVRGCLMEVGRCKDDEEGESIGQERL